MISHGINNSISGIVSPRLIAHYLPQFHPIPENDSWWGKGFTEWTNVSKATPLFRGHYQPHLPADLGYYDLRLSEVRQAQADLAAEFGIYGFCYYHYWFEGKRLINRPFDEILASGQPDFPFCLCWANETWSRTWLGEERQVLQAQRYSEDDDAAHSNWLAGVFADPRYIRVDGRPVFLVYNIKDHPDTKRLCAAIRRASTGRGLPDPYLVGVDSRLPYHDARPFGFDTTLHFEPMLSALPGCFEDGRSFSRFRRNARLGVMSARLRLYDYRESRKRMNARHPDHPTIPCVLVSWDNSPRRAAAGSIMTGCSPSAFEEELRGSLRLWKARKPQDDLFFLNAWNEWAEGNHLEPDQRWGRGYLEAVRKCLKELSAG